LTQTVATFYRFTKLPDSADWQTRLEAECKTHEVNGTIILATEGLNATVAGSKTGIAALLEFIRSDARFAGMPHRECETERETFHRLRIIIRPEIVTLGDPSVNPNDAAGEYVPPEDWNQLISDPEVLLIDTRNDYEVELGTFKNAINPDTAAFGEWEAFVQKNLNGDKQQKVAMFCTGGIRCEKASAHLLKEGFENVYHLQGGILKYLQETKPEESLWEGECFVFDHRVTVVHGLERGTCEICFGCRWPLTPEDLASPAYEPGICCPRCIDTLTPELRARREERQRQQTLARQRGEKHIGQHISTAEEPEQ
jgi:UPF0176 protein